MALKKAQKGGSTNTKSKTNKRGTTTTVHKPAAGTYGGTTSVTKKKKSGASTTFSKAARPTMGVKKTKVSKSGKIKVKAVSTKKVDRKITRASKRIK